MVDATIDTKQRCHDCGDEYEQLAIHQGKSDCEPKPIERETLDELAGLLLGDGTLNEYKFPRIECSSTNFRYLLELKQRHPMLFGDIYLQHCVGKDSGFGALRSSLFKLHTRIHPAFEQFISWYETGTSLFPDGYVPSKQALKQWYVGDGGVNIWKGAVEIGSQNLSDRVAEVERVFSEHGFDVSYSSNGIRLNAQSEAFLAYLGEPPRGFEYKWELDDRDRYERLMKVSKRPPLSLIRRHVGYDAAVEIERARERVDADTAVTVAADE